VPRLRFWRPDVRADVDEELAFHLEMRVRDLVAAGLSPAAARAAAERDFGDLGTVRAQCVTIDERRSRRDRRAEYVSDFLNDLRIAGRALRKAPGFAATAVLCVALGVGVTTTIFSAVHGILIRPLPYRDADRLVAVYAQYPAHDEHGVNISYPDYESWRDENRSLERLAIWTWTSHALSGGGEAERVEGAAVAATLFPMLGVRPLLGRTFVAAEEVPGRDREAILSYGLWQRRYGGDPSIVGRTITVDATPFEVVGVMPRGFNFPDRGELWVPFAPEEWMRGRGNRGIAGAIGRLKPGVTLEQAQADLAAVSARLQKAYPNDNFGWAAEAISLREDLVGDLRKPLLVFLGAVGLVLLIACANVANLMLARGAARQRELAVRAAIGAGGGRLVRQVLAECLMVAGIGGAAGAALAVGGVELLRHMNPDGLPFYITLALDRTALAFAVAVSLLTGLVFGAAPAVRAARVDLNASLRDGTRGAGDGTERSRLRGALVVAELALSVVLMVGAGLLIRSYRALEGTDLGFDERGVLTVRVSLPDAKYAERARRLAFYDALLPRVAAMPGVTTVGSAQGIPFSGWNVQGGITIEGKPAPRQGEEFVAHYQFVSPGYFPALGVPLVRGRALAPTDRDTSAGVVVINETFARRAFPGEDPIGRRVRYGNDPWVTVVGVMRDFRHYRLPQPMGPAMYSAYASGPTYTQTLAIRTSLPDPLALVPAVRAAARALDPDVPLYQVQTLAQQVSRSLWRQRMQGQVLGAFAALALLLSVVGLYGVVSYAVAQRTRELGVRMAIGASRRQVVRLVLGQGARLALVGVGVGLLGALALARVVESLLYGVDSLDPLTFVAVPALLCAVALLACWAPARRATRVDPLIAMRAE
jgi:putative ABC transport system permease protein